MSNVQQQIELILKSCGNHGPAVLNGYGAAGFSWSLISKEELELFGSTPDYGIEGSDLCDDIFVYTVHLIEESKEVLELEMFLAREDEDAPRPNPEKLWTDKVEEIPNLTSAEVRVDLAMRLRGKIRDYAGQWWETSAFRWMGYIYAMHIYSVITLEDCRYLVMFLPPACRSLFKELTKPR